MTRIPSVVLERMRNVAYFRTMSEEDLRWMLDLGRIHAYKEDETIFREGEPCAGFFVILSGSVTLNKVGPDGREVILKKVEPVIMFNEVAALDCGPNLVTARAVEPVSVWHADSESLDAMMTRFSSITKGMIRVLAARNRGLIARVEDLAFRSVSARIAKHLLTLSDNGVFPINRRRNPNTEMAASLSTVPEAFSRVLADFRKAQLIEVKRDAITVLNPHGLGLIAQIEPDHPMT